MPKNLAPLTRVLNNAERQFVSCQLTQGADALSVPPMSNNVLTHPNSVTIFTPDHELILLDLDDTLLETEVHYKELQHEIVSQLHILTGVPLKTIEELYLEEEKAAVLALGFSAGRQLAGLTALFRRVLNLNHQEASASTLLRQQLAANDQWKTMQERAARLRFLQEFLAVPAIQRHLFGSYALREGAQELLEQLVTSYHSVVIVTKGDGYLQGLKLAALFRLFPFLSGRVGSAILHQKTPEAYKYLITSLGRKPAQTTMIGDSVASDVQPPLEIGCNVCHIQGGTTWELERLDRDTLVNVLSSKGFKFQSFENLHLLAKHLREKHSDSYPGADAAAR